MGLGSSHSSRSFQPECMLRYERSENGWLGRLVLHSIDSGRAGLPFHLRPGGSHPREEYLGEKRQPRARLLA